MVTGRFNAIGEAVKAVSRRADKEGAASFYVVDTSDFGNSGNWRVVADLYKADAEKAEETSNRVINGVVELPKDQAVLIEPFDTVTVQGFYRSQPEVNDAITKAAKAKGAYLSTSFVKSMPTQAATSVLLHSSIKKDARNVSSRAGCDPGRFEAGRAALAAGGEAAKKRLDRVLRLPHLLPSSEIGRFFETQSSKAGVTPITLRMALKSKN